MDPVPTVMAGDTQDDSEAAAAGAGDSGSCTQTQPGSMVARELMAPGAGNPVSYGDPVAGRECIPFHRDSSLVVVNMALNG